MPILPSLSFQPYIEAPDQAPIQEYSNLLQGANQRYDQNLAQADALDEHISQLGTTINSVDQPILDSLNSDTRGALANIKQNGDWENAQVPIRMIAKRLLSDPALTVAQQNKQAVDKINSLQEQAQAEGHHIIQYSDPSKIPTQNPDGTFNRVTGNGVFDKKLDWEGKQKSFFEGLEANSSSGRTSSPMRDDSNPGSIYNVSSGSSYRGITPTRIAQAVYGDKNGKGGELDNYLNTDEGQQQLKVYTTTNSENQVPITLDQARAKIGNEMYNQGLIKVFHDTSSESSEKLAPAQKAPANPNDGTVAVQDPVVPINQDFSNLKDALTKKSRLNPGAIMVPGQGGLPSYAPPVLNDASAKPVTGYDNQALSNNTLYQSLSKMYSQLLGTTNPDKINPEIKAYLGNIENKSVQPILHATYDPKQMKADNEFIQNGVVKDLPIYDPSTGKQYDSMNDPSFKEAYPDIKPEDYEKARMVGKYDQDHPFAEVTGNDNFTTARKISIKGHDLVAGEMAQDKRSTTNLDDYLGNKISQSRRTGRPVTFTDGKTSTQVMKNPSGDGTYVVIGKDSQGKDLPLVPLTLDQAKNYLTATGNTSQK